MNEYVGELRMKEPLTKEDWDIIADTDFKHTSKVTFATPHCGEVEFVKVVRCKDCKWWREETDHTCRKWGGASPRKANGYCDEGEGRTDGTD